MTTLQSVLLTAPLVLSLPWHSSSRQAALQPSCEDYSFDFTFKPGAESAYRSDNYTAFLDDEYDEYDVFNVTYVDQTDYSEASYNFLLFPFQHPFKAPNIVAFEKNISQETTESKRSSWFSSFFGDIEAKYDVKAERGHDYREKYEELQLGLFEEDYNKQYEDYKELLKYEMLEKLEGCYPYVLPYLARTLESQQSEENETLASSWNMRYNLIQFGQLYKSIHQFNDGLESSHQFSSDQVIQFLNKFGSYFGIALEKDMSVMKCYIQEKLPKTFNDLRTHFKTIQIQKRDEEDGCDGCSYSVSSEVGLGLVKGLVSRPMSVVNTWAPSYQPLLRSLSDSAMVDTLHKYSSLLYSYIPVHSFISRQQAVLPHICSYSLSNHCWRQTLSSIQNQVSLENIGHILTEMLSYLGLFPIVINVGTDLVKNVASTFDSTFMSCQYDIFANDDLQWDSSKPTFSGESLAHAIMKPIGRETIRTLPSKIKKTCESIEADQNRERLILLVGEVVKKTSEIIQSESLKMLIQQKINNVIDWLKDIDVEAIHLNGLQFINTLNVAYYVTNLEDNASDIVPLVKHILDRIHEDTFWDVLEGLAVEVVNKRWLRVLAVVEHHLAPPLHRLSVGLDWLDIDFERNSRYLLDRAIKTITDCLQAGNLDILLLHSQWKKFRYFEKVKC